ncbi:hypothetical protein JMN32_02615 [Fulvivirga sp. 29W222]|uniref:Alpha/beta hydrolase n=1 Tax=Fulvivirga marina TaxID=2494733 RepID=A0A937FUF7_9BACT|nr:hypothetical protein [Fulvivirga marina]MBL6445183.1 hypothetical protein [Fulvivirga marina]
MNKDEIDDYFANRPQKPVIRQYGHDDHNINYAEIGNKKLPAIIFLHGAPGSWTAFIGFFSDTALIDKANNPGIAFAFLTQKQSP